MKKFIVASIIGTMALTNINIVMASASAPVPVPIVQSIDFAPISIEATEPVLWTSDFTGNELIAYDSQSLPINLVGRFSECMNKAAWFYYTYQTTIDAIISLCFY